MQRLTFALLLYEKEHGRLPEGDWREAVKPYLGENAEKYFRCPSHRLEEGYTNYAMIGNVPNSVSSPYQILLVEVMQPQKLGEGDGRIAFEKAEFWSKYNESHPEDCKDFDGFGSYHPGIVMVSYRNGAVCSLSTAMPPEELQKLLDGTATKLW